MDDFENPTLAVWEVLAGPSVGVAQFHREWRFTSDEWREGMEEGMVRYIDFVGSVYAYSMYLQQPRTMGWIRMQYRWLNLPHPGE